MFELYWSSAQVEARGESPLSLSLPEFSPSCNLAPLPQEKLTADTFALKGHSNLLNVQRTFLDGLFRAPHLESTDPSSTERAISLSNVLSYADRLRIRHPGDSKFALGPHIDGGGVERW